MNEETLIDQVLVIASGRVQGVGYRWWAKQAADRRGLTGSVRNLRDRTVEVRAVGDQDELVAYCGDLFRGPPGSRIDDLRILWRAADETPTDFTIIT
jgi:acylphosphatase